jgi:hypothetical protein
MDKTTILQIALLQPEASPEEVIKKTRVGLFHRQ